MRRTQNVLLAILTTVLLLTVIQLTRLSTIAVYNEPETPAYMEPDLRTPSRKLKFVALRSDSQEEESSTPSPTKGTTTTTAPPKRYAVVNFVDNKGYYLWGIYSIHNQMKKFRMLPAIKHVVLVASDMKVKQKKLLKKWLGKDNVIEVEKNFVRDHVPAGVWRTVFSKLEFFNLTQFDKVIGLDNDVFIRKDISHWFDLPAPAATQARSTIEWNSGAMVIEPNTNLFKKMLKYIPKIHVWDSKNDKGIDGYNSGIGHQGFLSSFFLSNITNDTMYTMSYGASVLSTDLRKVKENEYFWKYRNDAIETVHFTLDKPWSRKTVKKQGNPVLCAVMEEWLESVKNAPAKELHPLPNVLEQCPKEPETTPVPVTKSEKELKAEAELQKKLKRNKKALAALKKRRAARLAGKMNMAPTQAPPTSNTADLCFVTSVYGSEPMNAPHDVSELKRDDFVGSKFYLFTDRDDVNVPGWTTVVREMDYKRLVTQSRWAKYMSWTESFIQDCGIAIFVEGNLLPKENYSFDFRDQVDWILASQSRVGMNRAPRKEKHTLLAELKYALRTYKDSNSDIRATKKWFLAQPDFDERNHCYVYDTALIGYDPKNTAFQEAATFFWEQYSKEDGMGFDQPLWAYTLSKFELYPANFGGKRSMFFAGKGNLSGEEVGEKQGSVGLESKM